MESADSLGRGQLGAEWVLAQGKGEARTNQLSPYSLSRRNQKAERLYVTHWEAKPALH